MKTRIVIGVLAGLINDYLPDPGNFDRWSNDSDAGGLRLLNGGLHRDDSDPLAGTVVSVDLGADCRFQFHANSRLGIDFAGGDAAGIPRNAPDVVRQLSAETGLQLHFGHNARAFNRQSGPLQRLFSESPQAGDRDDDLSVLLRR